MLAWARENGCPWNAKACKSAAASGHLPSLRWLREHGCPWSESVCEAAAAGVHLSTLQWLRANGCPWDERTMRAALRTLSNPYYARDPKRRASVEAVLGWLQAEGCPNDSDAEFTDSSEDNGTGSDYWTE